MSPRLFAITTALMISSVVLVAAPSPASDEVNRPAPKRELDVGGLKTFEGNKRIAIPTLYVKLMTWGRMNPVPPPSTDAPPAGKKDRNPGPLLEIGMTVDAKVAQTIARELYDDLVAQFRAAGWQVLTFRELTSSTALFRLEQEEVDPSLGGTVDTTSPTKEKRRYIKIAPDRMPLIKETDSQGIAALNKVAREQSIPVLIPLYVFDPVAFEAGEAKGANLLPPLGERASLQLVYAGFEFVNGDSTVGAVHTRAPVQLWSNIGKLTLAPDTGPEMAYALPKKLAAEALKKKTLYLLNTDFEALQTCTLDSGKDFNRAAVQAMTAGIRK